MPISVPRSRRIVLALLVLLAACGDEGTILVSVPRVLTPGTWYLNTANGDTLPAQIAERSVGIALETSFLDSATLVVEAAGDYEQRYWLRILVTDVLDREEVVLDRGTWVRAGTSYAFTSTVRTRDFTLSVPATGTLTTVEPMLYWSAAPTVAGSYRLTRP